ncbi:flotillin domain-containing protein [Streptomyces sp. NPDC058695]|uniref:flotillin domain-containing protein n=1 Tax=Streptomyces sp. NPDC058695 TaxID=3346604 RepID=UPI003647662E
MHAEAERQRVLRHKKADAFARYGDAAVLQMVVEVLPSVVAKASEPLSAVDKMTVISTDGASQLSRTVADNVAQGVELLSSTTGVDLASLLKGLTSGSGSGAAAKGKVPAPAAGSASAADSNGRIEVAGE